MLFLFLDLFLLLVEAVIVGLESHGYLETWRALVEINVSYTFNSVAENIIYANCGLRVGSKPARHAGASKLVVTLKSQQVTDYAIGVSFAAILS